MIVEGTACVVLGFAAGAALTGELPPLLAGAALGAVAMQIAEKVMHANTCTLSPESMGKHMPFNLQPLFLIKENVQKK